MGLVDLKRIQIAFFSQDPSNIKESISICKENSYKSLFSCPSIPELISTLKAKKINALIFDPELGETDLKGFILALKKSFPKTKLIALITEQKKEKIDSYREMGISLFIDTPIKSKELIKQLQEIAMESLGIKSSQMTVDDNF